MNTRDALAVIWRQNNEADRRRTQHARYAPELSTTQLCLLIQAATGSRLIGTEMAKRTQHRLEIVPDWSYPHPGAHSDWIATAELWVWHGDEYRCEDSRDAESVHADARRGGLGDDLEEITAALLEQADEHSNAEVLLYVNAWRLLNESVTRAAKAAR